MTAGPRGRRAGADHLAVLLEERLGGDRAAGAAGADADHRVLLELADALRATSVDVPPMRSEFRAQLRADVLQAAREQRGTTPAGLTRVRDAARRFRYSTGLATGAGTAALALSGGGVAVAADLAQPDDLLYGVKLAIEDVRLQATFDDVSRGQRAIAYVDDRLEEARSAVARDADLAAAVALRGAADRAQEGTDLLITSGLADPLSALEGDLQDHAATLEALQPALGPEAAAAAQHLSGVLDASLVEVRELLGSTPPGLPDAPSPATPLAPTADVTLPPTVETPEVADPPTPGELTPSDAAPVIPGVPVPQPGPQPGPLPSLPGLPSSPGLPSQPLPGLGGVVDDATGTIDGVVDGVDGAVDGVGDAVEDLGGQIIDAVPGPVDQTVDQVPGVIDGVLDAVPEVLDGAGGLIDGAGGLLGG